MVIRACARAGVCVCVLCVDEHSALLFLPLRFCFYPLWNILIWFASRFGPYSCSPSGSCDSPKRCQGVLPWRCISVVIHVYSPLWSCHGIRVWLKLSSKNFQEGGAGFDGRIETPRVGRGPGSPLPPYGVCQITPFSSYNFWGTKILPKVNKALRVYTLELDWLNTVFSY